MSVEISILERKHGRHKSVLFTLIQDEKEIIASAEIWGAQSLNPSLERVFVKEKARRHGLWRFLLERRLKWLQENTEAKTVEAYIESKSVILNELKMNGFNFKDADPEEENRWMVKQLRI